MTPNDASTLVLAIEDLLESRFHIYDAKESYFDNFRNGSAKEKAVFSKLEPYWSSFFASGPFKIAYVSIGGADGAELAAAMCRDNVKRGILVEKDQDLVSNFPYNIKGLEDAQAERLSALKQNKYLHVFTGDCWARAREVNSLLETWFKNKEIDLALFSIQSVLHELQFRSAEEYRHDEFLSNLFSGLPNLALVCKEPCLDERWSGLIDLDVTQPHLTKPFVKFAGYIADKFSDVFKRAGHRSINPQGRTTIRMNGPLAFEVTKKLAYSLGDDRSSIVSKLLYESDECHYLFDGDRYYLTMKALFPSSEGLLHKSPAVSDNFRALWERAGFKVDRSDGLPIGLPVPFVEFVGLRIQERTLRSASSAVLPEPENLLMISGSRKEFTPSQLAFCVTDAEFKIGFPQDKIMRIILRSAAPEFKITDNSVSSLDGRFVNDAKALVPDIEDVLESAALKAADALIAKAERGEKVFNGPVYNVLHIPTAADINEHPLVQVQLYSSDYFTLQTLLNAFWVVRDRGVNLSDPEVRHALRIFRTGFGLNCTLCTSAVHEAGTSSDNAPFLVFGKRSKRAGLTASTGTWHVTVNEALTASDLRDQGITVKNWTDRAVHEEAGLKPEHIRRSYVLSVFLLLNDMQPGINLLTLSTVGRKELLYRVGGSMDGMVEYDQHEFLPFRNDSIKQALDDGGIRDRNTNQIVPFSPIADNTLRCILTRGVETFHYR